jgi:hypothetical protein
MNDVTDTISGFVQGIWLGSKMEEWPSNPIIRLEDAKMKYFAALDVSDKESWVCVVDQDGTMMKEGPVPTECRSSLLLYDFNLPVVLPELRVCLFLRTATPLISNSFITLLNLLDIPRLAKRL